MDTKTAGATERHTAFRVTGLSFAAPGTAEFSEVLTDTGQTNALGVPIYRNSAMTATIRPTGSDYSVIITDWPGHTSQEVERVLIKATPVD